MVTVKASKIAKKKTRKKYHSTLRFWHWANALVISGSLITVLINSTLFGNSKSLFVQSELQKSNVSINSNQAASLVHGMEDQIWNIHIYFGYVLASLLLFRILSEIFIPTESKLLTNFKKAYTDYFILKKQRELTRHTLLVKSLYLFFYLLILIMAVTGLTLAFKEYIEISKNTDHLIKDFHGFCMYLILGFIALHMAGVFRAERKNEKGIVSDMINGGTKSIGAEYDK